MRQRRFGLVGTDVIQDSELSLRAKAVYALLCTYSGDDRTCYPLVSTLCDRTNVSRRTMERILKELELKNYVTRKYKTFVLNDGLKKEEKKVRIP